MDFQAKHSLDAWARIRCRSSVDNGTDKSNLHANCEIFIQPSTSLWDNFKRAMVSALCAAYALASAAFALASDSVRTSTSISTRALASVFVSNIRYSDTDCGHNERVRHFMFFFCLSLLAMDCRAKYMAFTTQLNLHLSPTVQPILFRSIQNKSQWLWQYAFRHKKKQLLFPLGVAKAQTLSMIALISFQFPGIYRFAPGEWCGSWDSLAHCQISICNCNYSINHNFIIIIIIIYYPGIRWFEARKTQTVSMRIMIWI